MIYMTYLLNGLTGWKQVVTFIKMGRVRVDDFLTRLVNRLTQHDLFIMACLIDPTRSIATPSPIDASVRKIGC